MYQYISAWFRGVLNAGFAALILWMYLGMFLGEGRRENGRYLFWCPFVGWHFLWIWMTLNHMHFPFILNTVINISCVSIIAMGAYQGRKRTRIGFAAAYVGMDVLSEVFVWLLLSVFYPKEKLETLWWASVLSRAVMIGIMVFLAKIFRKRRLWKVDERYNVYLLFVSLGSIYVVHTIFQAYEDQGDSIGLPTAILCGIVMAGVNALVYLIHYDTCKLLELKQITEFLKYQMEKYADYKREQKESFLNIRRQRHDLRKNLLYLRELAKHERLDEMNQFLEEQLQLVNQENKTAIQTNNLAVDALINDKYRYACSKGIRFDMEIDISPDMPFAEADLGIILGNLLDNAQEAVERAGIADGYIRAELYYRAKSLVIRIENNYDGEAEKREGNRYSTSKTDKQNHGLGIGIVQATAEKYRGSVEIMEDGKKFLVQVILYTG